MAITMQKNMLLEVLARSPHDLQATFDDAFDAAGLWSSTVSLVSGVDGKELLSATARQSHPRKRDAHCAAAAALMAEDAFWHEAGVSRGVNQPPGVTDVAGNPANSSSGASSAFDTTFNYKNTLQELLQKAGSSGLPSYTSTSCGTLHRPLFTSTVTVNIPAWLAGAAAPLAAAVGHTFQVTATGTAQLSKRSAEQAASAAALRSPELQALRTSQVVRTYGLPSEVAAATA